MTCPMVENAPQTAEGWQAWDIGERASSQLLVAGMGVPLAVALPPMIDLARVAGADMAVMGVLLPAYAAGAGAGLRRLVDRRADREE